MPRCVAASVRAELCRGDRHGDVRLRAEYRWAQGRARPRAREPFGVDAAPYFRPSYGNHNCTVDAVAASLGYTVPTLLSGCLSDSPLIIDLYYPTSRESFSSEFSHPHLAGCEGAAPIVGERGRVPCAGQDGSTEMTPMSRVIRAAIVAVGVSVAGGLSVSAAQAAPSSHLDKGPAPAAVCTAGQIAAARADSAPKVSAYLQAHPDVDQELTALRAEPKGQHKTDAKAYFTAHPDVTAALKDARSAEHALRQQCRMR